MYEERMTGVCGSSPTGGLRTLYVVRLLQMQLNGRMEKAMKRLSAALLTTCLPASAASATELTVVVTDEARIVRGFAVERITAS